MKIRRPDVYNPKRKMIPPPVSDPEKKNLVDLARQIHYGGNPEHKRNPGDFGLTPPGQPRPGKTLCDSVHIVSRKVAIELLQEGMRRGLISEARHGPWPQNIWAVDSQGNALEAQLENPDCGIYHGYPMPESDPFRQNVLKRWKSL